MKRKTRKKQKNPFTIKPIKITHGVPKLLGLKPIGNINNNPKLKYQKKEYQYMKDFPKMPTVKWKPKMTKRINPHYMLDTDRDGVPDFRDCEPFNPKKHSNDSFDKAKEFFGTTDDPQESGWILPSGELLDFSGRKFNRMRNTKRGMGHIAVKYVIDKPGVEAINEFVNRGAIRFFKEEGGDVFASMTHKPTREQAIAIAKAINQSPKAKYMMLSRVENQGPVTKDVSVFETKNPSPILVQRFISQAFD